MREFCIKYKMDEYPLNVGALERSCLKPMLSHVTLVTPLPETAMLLVRALPSSSLSSINLHARKLHATIVRRDLVGPPDPVSHLRPVIYDDAPPPPPQVRHPYSLREFTGDTREYQWKMQRQELDTFNHAFWKEVRCLSYATCTSMFFLSLALV